MSSYKTMIGAPKALTTMSGLAKTFALPHEFPAGRLPSFPALERTAVMAFNTQSPLTVATYASGYGQRALIMRQAAYPVWVDTVWSNYVYTYTFPLTARVTASNMQEIMPMSGAYTGTNTIGNYIVTGTALPSGYAIVGMDGSSGSKPWAHFPQSSRINIVVDYGAATADGLSVTFEVWQGVGEVVLASVPLASSNNVWFYDNLASSVSLAGRWARPVALACGTGVVTGATSALFISVYGAGGATAFVPATRTLAVLATTFIDLLPLTPPPAFTTSTVPYSSTRVTAVSLLATNVTKVLNKEGTVNAARINPRILNPFTFLVSDLTALHPAEKYYAGLEQGFYTYVPPSTDLAEFHDCTLTLNTIVPTYRLDNSAFINAVSFNDPDGGTNLALNVDWHIEFRSSSVLWPVGVSTVTLEALHQAQIVLLSAGFFFDNIDHKRVLANVIRAANFIAPSLGAVGFPIKAAAKVGSYMLRGSGSTPKPTSATSNGMVVLPKGTGRKVSGKKKKVTVKGKKKKK